MCCHMSETYVGIDTACPPDSKSDYIFGEPKISPFDAFHWIVSRQGRGISINYTSYKHSMNYPLTQ